MISEYPLIKLFMYKIMLKYTYNIIIYSVTYCCFLYSFVLSRRRTESQWSRASRFVRSECLASHIARLSAFFRSTLFYFSIFLRLLVLAFQPQYTENGRRSYTPIRSLRYRRTFFLFRNFLLFTSRSIRAWTRSRYTSAVFLSQSFTVQLEG